MPTILRDGPYRYFFYSAMDMNHRTFTLNEMMPSPSSGCTR